MKNFNLSFSSSERLRSRYDEIYMINSNHLTYFKIPRSFMKENMIYNNVMQKYNLKKGKVMTFNDVSEFVVEVVDIEGKVDIGRGSFKPKRNNSCKKIITEL